VWFNNLLVVNLVPTASNLGVNHFSGTVQLTKCSNVLQFDGTGISDGYGVTIANVKLYTASNSINRIVNGDFSQPALLPGTWQALNGGIHGWSAFIA
jgi:hypothetical protein